ncbi:GDSL-type esterase/lipase family protein [Microbispora sp. ATCC PTA-5024]|uniref:GDSL-type esterase/lipase family protein n=1 Tax=Microbispora sp. ATCC PTA-5024 TaxID=316330 RepID=UPI0003DC0271|nr:GDSL-type esterase/lipase family protein [Microbispora sp. ATCC PTA-5024]ETK37196.1 hypothetical protein MPTA5024_05125 [Microbispora sp. ATCC PTA-5024]
MLRPTIMIVGDSISQGLEGDYTWRYRLARHFDAHGVAARFVGPWTGTATLPVRQPPGYPARAAEPGCEGRYRPGIHFPGSRHYARWGRLLAEAKDGIGAAVAAHRPEYLMVGLGFNDLAWGVSGPGRLLDDVGTFVREARAAGPRLRFLVADIVHRTPLGHSPDLPRVTASYNERLPGLLHRLSTNSSPIVPVGLAGVYDPRHDAYDGLHPNSAGEFTIAKAFADAFSAAFAGGRLDFAVPIPRTPDPLPIRPPRGLTVRPYGRGVRISWTPVFGASGYWLHLRDTGSGEPFRRSELPVAATSCDLSPEPGRAYEVAVSAARGPQETVPTGPVAFALGAPLLAAGLPSS